MDDGRHVGHDLHGLLLDVAHGEVAVLLVTQVTRGRNRGQRLVHGGQFAGIFLVQLDSNLLQEK